MKLIPRYGEAFCISFRHLLHRPQPFSCRRHASGHRALGQGVTPEGARNHDRSRKARKIPGGAIKRAAFRSLPDPGKKRRMADHVRVLPGSETATRALLEEGRYVADDALVKTLYLSFALGRPLLLEGEAGCGKTQLAATLAETLGRRLLRLQCHEGLDSAAAVYEWNYAAQMLAIRLAERGGTERDALAEDIFGERFLVKRPLLTALEPDPLGPPVLLIDRDRPRRCALRGLPAGGALRVSGERARGGHGDRRRAAHRGHHLQPHTRGARRPQAALPLPLGRLPRRRAGEGDPARPPAGDRATVERQHRRLHRAHAEGRSLHGAGARRGDRVVERRCPARPDRARPREPSGPISSACWPTNGASPRPAAAPRRGPSSRGSGRDGLATDGRARGGRHARL